MADNTRILVVEGRDIRHSKPVASEQAGV